MVSAVIVKYDFNIYEVPFVRPRATEVPIRNAYLLCDGIIMLNAIQTWSLK